MANAAKKKRRVAPARTRKRSATSKPGMGQIPNRKRKKGNATDANAKARVSSKVAKIAQKDNVTMEETMFLWVALGGDLTGPKGAAVAAAVKYQENGSKTKGCAGCCCGGWMYNVIPVPSNPSPKVKTVDDANNFLLTTRETIKYVNKSGWGPWEAHPDGGGNFGNYYNYLDEAKAKLKGASATGTLVGFDLGDLGDGDFWRYGPGGLFGGGKIQDELNIGPDAPAFSGGPGIGDIIGAIGDPQFWLRAGKVLIGCVLLFMAANALSKALIGADLTDAIPAKGIKKIATSKG